MGVAVFHDDVVTAGIENLVESGCESEWTGGVRGDVDDVECR